MKVVTTKKKKYIKIILHNFLELFFLNQSGYVPVGKINVETKNEFCRIFDSPAEY